MIHAATRRSGCGKLNKWHSGACWTQRMTIRSPCSSHRPTFGTATMRTRTRSSATHTACVFSRYSPCTFSSPLSASAALVMPTESASQDFEGLTPNLLARTIETVEGGGAVVLLLSTLRSLTQLFSLTMDAHARLKTESHQTVRGAIFIVLCPSLSLSFSLFLSLGQRERVRESAWAPKKTRALPGNKACRGGEREQA